MKKISELLEQLNIKTNNLKIYEEALTHKSFSNENNLKYDYQRLEFLGDAVVELLSTRLIFNTYPSLTEGEMTIIRANSVKGDMLCKFSIDLGLDTYARFGNSKADLDNNNKILADIFESFIAAVYIDQGEEKVNDILKDNLYDCILSAKGKELKNPKTLLQEYLQLESREAIRYETKEHNDEFVSDIYHDGNHFGKGFGKTKKEAEVEAARKALQIIGKVKNETN